MRARLTYGRAAMLVLLAASLLLAGCYRGRPSQRTPIHMVRDMDSQPKYQPMERTEFFGNEAIMRTPPAGTVARGQLRGDAVYFTGVTPAGDTVRQLPVAVTLPFLQRGRERFDIYCSPCHGRVGDGKGIMVQRGYVPPPTFHDARLRSVADGHIFDVITHGLRNMPAYQHQISVEDRWAIVAYLRALQRSQNASAADVPEEIRRGLRP
ncbi:MAG TPA: cytochrome c [candidate division Zixibacteria bacterium]|nr:cytochrome c [candidate division Zixibacteria bacterium]HOD66000.1 cytochrome c [candidate division Zixibacteria bacterium]HOZ07031.1 cytochrome c [candidate division Zixibacteria bacterium]HPM38587.1 cytochrome c [candidate division Zixibacteria bacterium]